MYDENAFGLLIAYHDIEDDEYSLDREAFVERFRGFRRVVEEYAMAHPPGDPADAVDLGHAIYFELSEGDQSSGPVSWLRALRALLAEHEYRTVAVVAHGSRWVGDSGAPPRESSRVGELPFLRVSAPSEPLRRALFAEAACHGEDDDEGWGPGLYLDTEAVEALELRPKNAPTVLRASGAGFFRVGA